MHHTGFLFTDHYQLTMAQLYHAYGLAERTAQFDYFYRANPDYGNHQAGYAITAGLGPLLAWFEATSITPSDLEALARVPAGDGSRLFGPEFLGWLADAGSFSSMRISAVPEGRVVHPNTPIGVVEGPLAIAQIAETPLLNQLNFASLIATKTSRVVEAAHGGDVLEFGARRAPAWGANAATRAALIGGASATSNIGAALDLNARSAGTHGHAMIQVFMAVAGGELEAFQAFADVYPDDCVLLVDTIDTLQSGVPHAIRVFEELRRRGHQPVGIRLDSGDLAHLAVRSAAMLDAAGFDAARIVLSSQLDELTIWQIRNQIVDEAPRYGVDADALLPRLVYGVGSRMVTSDGDSSFDGVYKAVAVADDTDTWQPAIKLSNSPIKMQNPGRKALWRVYDRRGLATADVVSLAHETLEDRPLVLLHPDQPGVERILAVDQVGDVERLLQPVWAEGRSTGTQGGVEEARRRRQLDIDRLDPGVRRLVNPHRYHVSLTQELSALKRKMIEQVSDP